MSDAIETSSTPADSSVWTYRRLVTGEDAQGKAVFLTDETCPHTQTILGVPTFASTELWKTTETPARLDGAVGDPAAGAAAVGPPAGGTVLRVVEFPPDRAWADTPAGRAGTMMHRTSSIDYSYVIDGEIFAVLDTGEKLMRTGDVLVQRGTNHAWSNRSDKPARVLFVLIDAVLPG